ncbi:PstS family phosphate ABC transporter substrate-binding protein [Staphylococcus massiliensis]|uniref:Phosphate-binding protein n=1 Tax=Staphylococcus massiliensis S46 TaxID=1229783 RepID=K9B530_9STAP|nr:PstS family phosphate ABC transporter substrate-binding protein [Staphylococcus massiliensis]EKU49887.1 phosphate binding protein [Staphylococcus massiliensis S46]MCG3398991.1 PstS family phosphate ABC transporter substrate-binding protein [Staphylococcus massiliensis]MCG3401010.1 PstS family phosphate ABC transporter substrate-binding protein [Staphylococcus massiliensis]MCG3413040.1 PstS family phosphate ABC transporter substrate-binding protein [Staphylococcus massiliensis]POA02020.1 thi
MKKLHVLGATTASAALLLAACGGAGQSESGSGSGGGQSDLSGKAKANGSSTVAPVVEKLNEEWAKKNPQAQIESVTSGTGDGFKKFISGDTDFSNASRPIKDDEKKQLKDKGIDYTEFTVGLDGLTVAVNKENDFVEELSMEELKKIYTGEAKTWKDVNSKYPDKEIKAFSPDQSHGTYDFFTEHVTDKKDLTSQKNQKTDVIVKSVEDNKNGIGFFGYSFFQENKDKLKPVKIKGDKGEAVEPTKETIQDKSYPLSRELFIYANNKKLKENKVASEFMKFALEDKGKAAEDAGYVALPEDKYKEQLDKLKKISGGSEDKKESK